jgi:hypothetical protein
MTVCKKDSADVDARAGIVICVSGMRVLREWGPDLEGARMATYKEGYILQGTTLEVPDVVYGEERKL